MRPSLPRLREKKERGRKITTNESYTSDHYNKQSRKPVLRCSPDLTKASGEKPTVHTPGPLLNSAGDTRHLRPLPLLLSPPRSPFLFHIPPPCSLHTYSIPLLLRNHPQSLPPPPCPLLFPTLLTLLILQPHLPHAHFYIFLTPVLPLPRRGPLHHFPCILLTPDSSFAYLSYHSTISFSAFALQTIHDLEECCQKYVFWVH